MFWTYVLDFDALQDCILGDVADGGCDAFIKEECKYFGQETAFSAPPGQITNPTECEEHCLTWEVSAPFK